APLSPTIRHRHGARFGPQTVRKWPANGPQTDLPTDSKTDPQTPRKPPMTSQDTTADTERPALTRNRESDSKPVQCRFESDRGHHQLPAQTPGSAGSTARVGPQTVRKLRRPVRPA